MALKKYEQQEQTRLRGVAMLREGFSPTEISQRLGVARLTVYRWKSRGRGKGATIRHSGRKPLITLRQRRQLEKILERGAVAAGFATEVWTGRRIAQVLWQRFGVQYHFKAIPLLLRSWGWSWQKPHKQAIERDQAKVERWVRYQWPRIKKSPAAGRDADVCR
jgi:transposase